MRREDDAEADPDSVFRGLHDCVSIANMRVVYRGGRRRRGLQYFSLSRDVTGRE